MIGCVKVVPMCFLLGFACLCGWLQHLAFGAIDVWLRRTDCDRFITLFLTFESESLTKKSIIRGALILTAIVTCVIQGTSIFFNYQP